jgi:hypothetical protein
MLVLHPRIHALAERALAIANNDAAVAIRVLNTTSGMSPEMCFEAIDWVITHPREAAE